MKSILCCLFICISGIVNASELFVKVNKIGAFYAVVGNQTQYNSSNIFRFFDLNSGFVNLQIVDQYSGSFLMNKNFSLGMNQRVVVEVDQFGNSTVIETVNIQTPNWYTSNSINSSNFPSGNNPIPGTGMHDSFQQFLNMLNQESFDSKKLTEAKKYADKTMMSSQQITEVAKLFSFDSNRLDWAKYAYKKCYDPANYFLLKPVFSFQSNYRILEEYIEKL
jgi:hypothetical protein